VLLLGVRALDVAIDRRFHLVEVLLVADAVFGEELASLVHVLPRLLDAELGHVVCAEVAAQIEARRVVLRFEIVVAAEAVAVVVRRFFGRLGLDGLGCRVCGLRRTRGDGLPNDFSSLTPKRRLDSVEEPHALLLLVGGRTRLHETSTRARWRKSELRS